MESCLPWVLQLPNKHAWTRSLEAIKIRTRRRLGGGGGGPCTPCGVSDDSRGHTSKDESEVRHFIFVCFKMVSRYSLRDLTSVFTTTLFSHSNSAHMERNCVAVQVAGVM